MCNHAEARIYEPLECAPVVNEKTGEIVKAGSPERVRKLRATYGDSYHRPTGAYTIPGHDCEYVEARNALIPAASRVARQETDAAFPDEADRSKAPALQFESRAFLAAMTRLWKERRSTRE